MLPSPRLLSVALIALALTACGGRGGSDGPTFLPGLGAVIPATPSLDGSIESSGTVVVASGLRVGDIGAGGGASGIRSVVSFDMSRVPPGAFIETASLRLYQVRVAGNPYTTLGEVAVEGTDLGATLDAADFQDTVAIPFPLGSISTDATIGGCGISSRSRPGSSRPS